jgi:hypothetical protein
MGFGWRKQSRGPSHFTENWRIARILLIEIIPSRQSANRNLEHPEDNEDHSHLVYVYDRRGRRRGSQEQKQTYKCGNATPNLGFSPEAGPGNFQALWFRVHMHLRAGKVDLRWQNNRNTIPYTRIISPFGPQGEE